MILYFSQYYNLVEIFKKKNCFYINNERIQTSPICIDTNLLFIVKLVFHIKKMWIIICNVLLYNTMNKTMDFIPSCPSGLTLAYVSRKDFLNTVNDRVSVFYDDTTKNHQLIEKFIDFDDLHLIRPDFYVRDTLYLTKTQKKTLKAVQSIQNTADQKHWSSKWRIWKRKFFCISKSEQNKERTCLCCLCISELCNIFQFLFKFPCSYESDFHSTLSL